MKNQVIDEDMT